MIHLAAIQSTTVRYAPSHEGAGRAHERPEAAVESSSSAKEGHTTEQGEKTEQSRPLSPEQQRELQQLQRRDREVKAHEAAHMAAAAGLISSGMSFTYQTGPDGRRYAVGGEVSIDSSAVPNDPQATLDKALQVQAAALAPAQPSSQDRAVAARAARMAAEARVELAEQRREEAADMPVVVGTRSALDAYRSDSGPAQASVLDQTV